MNSASLSDLVLRQDFGTWKNEFQRIDVSIRPDRLADVRQLLASTLIETRFSLRDLDQLFVAFAIDRGLSEEDAESVWEVVKDHVADSIVKGAEHINIESNISNEIKNLKLVTTQNIVTLVTDFRKLCFGLINLAMQYNPANFRHTIGVLGELLSFLYARDIVSCDCIHHKLIPDTIMAFRHGMDLLAVKFNQTCAEDEVYFIEAKATTSRINAQRDEVIDWFNTELTTKANTMIDQAKRTWRSLYPAPIFKRASRALSRFQIYAEEIAKSPARYVGSILVDANHEPTDDEILGFRRINYSKKQLIIIKAPCMVDLSKEIFDLACKT